MLPGNFLFKMLRNALIDIFHYLTENCTAKFYEILTSYYTMLCLVSYNSSFTATNLDESIHR